MTSYSIKSLQIYWTEKYSCLFYECICTKPSLKLLYQLCDIPGNADSFISQLPKQKEEKTSKKKKNNPKHFQDIEIQLKKNTKQ